MSLNYKELNKGVYFTNKDNQLLVIRKNDYSNTIDIINQTGNNEFVITPVDEIVYDIFSVMYSKIKNSNLFEITEDELNKYKTQEEKEEALRLIREKNNNLYFGSSHKKIFREDKVVIESELGEEKKELTITKENEKFVLEFKNSTKDNSAVSIKINDSEYSPFNNLFVNAYKVLRNESYKNAPQTKSLGKTIK